MANHSAGTLIRAFAPPPFAACVNDGRAGSGLGAIGVECESGGKLGWIVDCGRGLFQREKREN